MTEPRRIAAISAAERIRYEMDKKEPFIAHHIRYETKVTAETKISVMTDGVLLKQMATDFLLKNYSVIILDEAHERYLFIYNENIGFFIYSSESRLSRLAFNLSNFRFFSDKTGSSGLTGLKTPQT